ncbi:GNAT family N-acetyltransferase [Pullulanibacillus sp. KACC 23026]|uniref:GNAT family N-acetyltransferase n=1 Tax=Pullulanibacillus sp. KACC 23026 TaxID=3028315 RepID=UPI0023B1D493|nr:GNAT family N-acetyltransferase [Pullulanibacillus sp. KACC 23026]WEG13526.1 GNAT family N-acetyltransferase [Pullulanibacillus sp. KACC 23026]
MGIRKARVGDWKSVCGLLEQLDYYDTESFIREKIEALINHPDEELLVYEISGKVIAFISIHYIPQLALKGDFARISYFAVDSTIRSQGIGRDIEAHCTDLAIKRNCDRIEVHCHSRRKDAHRFYARQGYTESPNYFMKRL